MPLDRLPVLNITFFARYLEDVKQFFKPLNLHFGKKWLFMSKTFTISPEDYLIISVSFLAFTW